MRALMIPVYTNPNIGACATYIWIKHFIGSVLAARPDAFFHLPVPKNTEYDFADIKHPRVELIPMHLTTKSAEYTTSLMTAPEEIYKVFSDASGLRPLDIIFTTAPATAVDLAARMFSLRKPNSVRPPIVSLVEYGFAENTPVPDAYKIKQAAGLLASDASLWQSRASVQRTMKMLGAYLTPSARGRIVTGMMPMKSAVVPIASILEQAVQAKPTDRWVVNYGYAVNNTYRFKETFEVFDLLFCAGYPVEVMLTASSAVNLRAKEIRDLYHSRYEKYFKRYPTMPQKDFWRNVSRAHAFLFMATDFEASYSVIEQFLLGMIGVFADSPFAREFLVEGYPYIADGGDTKTLCTLLKYVLENYQGDEVQGWLAKQRARIMEHYDFAPMALDTWDRSVALSQRTKDDTNPSPSQVELLKSIFAGKDDITWSDFLSQIKDKTEFHVELVDADHLSRCASVWRFAMDASGWKDDCQTPDVVFRSVIV